MDCSEQIVVVIAGLGSAGERWAKTVRERLPEARIVALRRRGRPPHPLSDTTVTSINDALVMNPDLAVLSGPATERLRLATQLGERGVHLLLEKPLSTDSVGIPELRSAVRRTGVSVAVAYNLRFYGPVRRLKNLVDTGQVGRVESVYAEVGQYLPAWRPGVDYRRTVSSRKETGGGVLLELSHEIDLVKWVGGPITAVTAELGNVSRLELDVEDLADLLVQFASGARGAVHLDMVTRQSRRRVTVTGDAGTVECDLVSGQLRSAVTGDSIWRYEYFHEGIDSTYARTFADFIDSVQRGTSPMVGLDDAAATLEVIDAARTSAASGRRVRIQAGAQDIGVQDSRRVEAPEPPSPVRPPSKGYARRRLAVICARGGSKGVPGKNLLELGGETLLELAVRQARESTLFDVIVVSSDDEVILFTGQRAGADLLVRRPGGLATDAAPKMDAIRHAVHEAEAQYDRTFHTVVDLDVTTPLRLTRDIADVVHLLESSEAGNVVTASRARRSPYFNQVEIADGGVLRVPCGRGDITDRQSAPPVYDLTGAVYAWRRDVLEGGGPLIRPDTLLHIIPSERGWDIDEAVDVDVVAVMAGITRGRDDLPQ